MNQTIPPAYIKQVSKNITDEHIGFIVSCAQSCHLKKGEFLLKEGEICHCIYLVTKGYLRNYTWKDGESINLNFTLEGGYTSNLKSIYNREPSELTIEAGEDSTVWIFDFERRYDLDPEIVVFVRRVMTFLSISAEQHSNLFKIYSPTERYWYIEKNTPQLLQRVSLSQIASYLGVTRKTLTRIRAKKTVLR
jgi:CRP-like cAMP-binding protein